MALISGLMVVRNGVSQGYPFVEAITAALPICDEFLISDGFSLDGTWEALNTLAAFYPGQIRLFQDRWAESIGTGTVIADVTNVLKRRCRLDYCLNIQANEIVHEATLGELRELATLYPEAELFRIPFLTIMGESLTWHADFRRRLFRNRPYVISKSDGFDCGYAPKLMWSQPGRLYRYILHRTGDQLVYLTKPVYRYRAIFPKNYLAKLEEHCRTLTRSPLAKKELEYARSVWAQTKVESSSPEAFWSAMRNFFDEAIWRDNPPGIAPDREIPRRCIAFPLNSPEIMKPLFGKWQYDVKGSLAALRDNSALRLPRHIIDR